jgi:hypothetical protein
MHEQTSAQIHGDGGALQSAAFLFDYSVGSVSEVVWKAALLFFDLLAVKASERTWHGISASKSDIDLLAEQGFVRWLPSEDIADRAFVEQLGEGIVDLLANGAFDLAPPTPTSMARARATSWINGSRISWSTRSSRLDLRVQAIHTASTAFTLSLRMSCPR